MNIKTKKGIGYLTVIITLIIISFWSYWGINEAFHEGWYHVSLIQNIMLTFVQYLLIPILFIVITVIAVNHRRTGASMFIILGIFALFFFNSHSGRVLIFIPMIALAAGFYFGEFNKVKKKIIMIIVILLPSIIILLFGIPLMYKTETRYNDNDFTERMIIGNEVILIWARKGPGFPETGTNWYDANENCARLSREGTEITDEEINMWRLATRDEIVRSLTRDDINAGGRINEMGKAEYDISPDKETPLWDPYSQVIYTWTSEEKDDKSAYLVSYNGRILSRSKGSGPEYQGYRCVKDI